MLLCFLQDKNKTVQYKHNLI